MTTQLDFDYEDYCKSNTTYNISLKQHLHQVLHDESLADEVIEKVGEWLSNVEWGTNDRATAEDIFRNIGDALIIWELPEAQIRKLPFTEWIFPKAVKINPESEDEIPF